MGAPLRAPEALALPAAAGPGPVARYVEASAASLAHPFAVGSAGRPQWSSDQLFGDRQEIEIAHGESIYRLRVTSLGKLILTK